MQLNWRVVWGAMVIAVLIIAGSYFGSHWVYQLDDELLTPPPTLSNLPITPIESHPTAQEYHLEPELESITSTEEMSVDATAVAETSSTDETETRQVIRETLAQLRIKKEKLEEEIDQVSTLRTELANQSIIDSELLNTEVTSVETELEKEINRLVKILETKLGTNPTLEECQATEEWHQMRDLARLQDGGLSALVSLDNSYHQKSKEIAQKEAKLFDERLAVMRKIKDLESQLAAE